MMKLNTFKDYEKDIGIFNEDNLFQIKADAIKWINTINDGGRLTISNGLPETDKNSIMLNKIDKKGLMLWIKHFFNIDESELK